MAKLILSNEGKRLIVNKLRDEITQVALMSENFVEVDGPIPKTEVIGKSTSGQEFILGVQGLGVTKFTSGNSVEDKNQLLFPIASGKRATYLALLKPNGSTSVIYKGRIPITMSVQSQDTSYMVNKIEIDIV